MFAGDGLMRSPLEVSRVRDKYWLEYAHAQVHTNTHTQVNLHTHMLRDKNVRDPAESKPAGKNSCSPCRIWMPHANFPGPPPVTIPLHDIQGQSLPLKVESAGSLLSQGRGKWFRCGALCSKGSKEA